MKKVTYYCDKCGKSINTEKEPYIRAEAKAVITDWGMANYSEEEKDAFAEKYLKYHYVRNSENYTHGYDILCKECGERFIQRVESLRALLKTF